MTDSNQPAHDLRVGLTQREQMVVEERHTVPGVAASAGWDGFADMPPVFATAMMIGFLETTCIEALRPYLTEGQRTVGTHVDVSHVAATPVGMTVTAEVELVAVEKRALTFRVVARDEAGVIGEGTHRRAIIDADRFLARLAEKSGG